MTNDREAEDVNNVSGSRIYLSVSEADFRRLLSCVEARARWLYKNYRNAELYEFVAHLKRSRIRPPTNAEVQR